MTDIEKAKALRNRLKELAADLKAQAAKTPAGPERDRLLKRARHAETEAHLDDWSNSSGLQPPD